MNAIFEAILNDDRARVKALLKELPERATVLCDKATLFDAKIFHWLYVGDTPLHLAAAGYRIEIAQTLVKAGADVNAAQNMRRGRPLHYAADGPVGAVDVDADRQVNTIQFLLDAGAEIDAQDKNGATALHRAVRTRCAAAVRCLLNAGANPEIKIKPGSTPFHLAVQNTGRGGSGAAVAIEAQRQIIAQFLARGVSTDVTDGSGKSVVDCARSGWVREMLS